MFCEKCGNTLEDGAKFCDNCGWKVEGTPAPVQGTPETAVRAVLQTAKEREKKPGKASFTAVCVALSVLIVLLGTGAGTIFEIRHLTEKQVLEELAEEVDLANMKLNFMKRSSSTPVKLIQKNAEGSVLRYLDEDALEKLLGEKFVKKFTVKKIGDYVDDLLHNTGKGVIKSKEIQDLLEDNAKTISKDTGLPMNARIAAEVGDVLKEKKTLKDTDLSKYRADHKVIFGAIRFGLSYGTAWGMLVLAALLSAGIFFLQERKIAGLSYLGINLAVIGLLDILTGFLAQAMLGPLKNIIDPGRGFWRLLGEKTRAAGLITGGLFLAAGLICQGVYIAIKLRKQPKQA